MTQETQQLKLQAIKDIFELEIAQHPKALISLSHTHYLTVTGGTENVIATESIAMIRAGWSYIHITPLEKNNTFHEERGTLGQKLILTVNGIKRGIIHAFVLSTAIFESSEKNHIDYRLVIHHLLGFELHSILSIIQALRKRPSFLWIHDFFTLCTDPFLLRNDQEFCGAPPSDSASCLICTKGRVRNLHTERIKKLFQALQPIVIAPSHAMLEAWKPQNQYKISDTVVVPLALVEIGKLNQTNTPSNTPLRVAYIGAKVWHKGWNTYQRLLDNLKSDPRYEFYRFGYGASKQENPKEVDVIVTPEDPTAMIRAIEKFEIDVAIIWSECHESFSFVTCEALAAGASVITRSGAGNIPFLTKNLDPDRSVILNTESELISFFNSGRALNLKGRRRRTGRISRTNGTATLLLQNE